MPYVAELRGGPPGRPLSILSFTTVFPRPGALHSGIFIRSRLQAMAARAQIQVVAPVAWVEYGNPNHLFPERAERVSADGRLAVFRPRWFYLPGTPWLTPALLALCSLWSLRRLKFDVIDAHFGHPAGEAACLLSLFTGRPFTVTLRGNETSHAQARLVGWWMRWALRRAGRVIAVSERLRAFAIRMGVEPDRAVTIPNGVDPATFYPRDRTLCRAKLGMREQAKHILSAGCLIERKGHHHAIEALGQMRKAGLDAELWIVGDRGGEGDFEEPLRALTARLNLQAEVHFVPGVPQNDLAEYMTAADVLCLASSREGWPNVVHEALACGTPAVATDVGGVPDMLPDRAYGFVVPAGDAVSLRNSLELAVRTVWDREAISRWGHARTWSAVGEETVRQLELAALSARGE